MLTKLDAVNELLAAINEAPVASLESGLDDADKAVAILDRISSRVQQAGWHCNTRITTLAPDTAGNIVVPSTAIRVDTVGVSSSIDVSERVDPNDNIRKLWRDDTETFVFASSLKVEIIYELAFDNMTPALRTYIASRAAVTFQSRTLGAEMVDKNLKLDMQEAWSELLDDEAEREDSNLLTGNSEIAYARSGGRRFRR